MSASRRSETRQKVGLALRARRFARENAAVVSVLALVVIIGVTALLTRRVLAAKHQIRVLDCPVTHAVAHHHDKSCYDNEGNLICALPERDLHVHNESCYERQLICGLEEGAGIHVHDESCYDENGNIVCGQEAGQGHVHDGGCYADVLVCDREEVTEEHVHGDGCFRVVAANEDAPEYTHPALTLSHDVYNQDKQLQLRVDAAAPEGALPDGAKMDVVLLDPAKVDLKLLQQALDEHASGQQGAEQGQVLRWQAVRISFLDSSGREIEPKDDVTIKLTSSLADTDDACAVVRMDNPEGAGRVLKRGEQKVRKDGEPENQVMEQLSDEQREAQRIKLGDDQIAFEACESATYVLTTTSLRHGMAATDGSTVSITVDAPAEAGVPQDAVLDVKRVSPDTDEYGDYVARSVEAMGADQADVALASFFDIHIKDADGNELQPKAPVDVKLELADIPAAPNGFAAVHFKATGEEAATELEQLECGGQDGTITFSADSFSVYGIVYTVDFGYEVEGQLYEYTLSGGSPIGLRELAGELHIHEGGPKAYESVDAFMADVTDVSFSSPNYLWLQHVSGRTTLQSILDEYDLHPEGSGGAASGQSVAYAETAYEDDWVLISLAPFATTEMLTITMADGTERFVAVTDAQEDVQLQSGSGAKAGGLRASGAPTPISNPADTRIDLFDYWVDDDLRTTAGIDADGNTDTGKAWPPSPEYWKDQNGNDNIHNHSDDTTLADGSCPTGEHNWDCTNIWGDGYNQGINGSAPGSAYEEHNLKFNPGNYRTVPDGPVVNGQWTNVNNNDGDYARLNSYTGSTNVPYQGIVENTLNTDGFPTLTNTVGEANLADNLGTDGEPLNYLFDTSYHAGKQAYPNVNKLMYVDEDGYYCYDSKKYGATFVANPNYKPNYDPTTDDPDDQYSGTFELSAFGETTDDNYQKNGFWPFGDRVFWHGMHVQTNFSMPHPHGGKKAQVLNPKGEYKDMVFEFEGDDDTWIYIDGVLVGDGGGIHGRLKIQIDFSDGSVKIYGSDLDTPCYETTIREAYVAAGKAGDYEWDGDTFKAGTHHTLDMFYLERGGNESNLELRYNLISTADFSAHKAYRGQPHEVQGQMVYDPLARDQFVFELIGLAGEYSYTINGDDFSMTAPGADDEGYSLPAVMPEGTGYATAGSIAMATVDNPYYDGSVTVQLSDGSAPAAQVYATGVLEDGNVNFGTADTSDLAEHMAEDPSRHPAYRYIIREYVPDNAVNPNGIRWADATEAQRQADNFVYNNIHYDGTTYYMVGYLVDNGDHSYSWKKKYFTRDDFATQVNNDPTSSHYDPSFPGFLDFNNRYVPDAAPLTLDIVKKDEAGTTALPGATFSLSKAAYDETDKVWSELAQQPSGYPMTDTTVNQGNLSFAGLEPGFYILEETTPPPDYELPQNKWLVTVTRKLDGAATPPESHLEASVTTLSMQGAVTGEPDDTGNTIIQNERHYTQEIRNTKFHVKVEKHWEGIEASHSAIGVNNGRETTVEVTLGRYTIEDVAGTLSINKYGVPVGASPTITYTVYDKDGVEVDSFTVSDGAWASQIEGTPLGNCKPIATLNLFPDDGPFTVVEEVVSDDPKFNATHADTGQPGKTATIVDGQTTTVDFTATYAPKHGRLYIKSTLVNNSSKTVNPSGMGITYAITDNLGNSVFDTNGNELAQLTYDDVKNGLTIDNIPLGRYWVIEEGWDDVEGTVRSHDPEQSNGAARISALVTDGGTASFEFEATYDDKTGADVYVVLYKYDFDQNDVPRLYDERPREYGPFTIEGNSLTFRYRIGTGDYASLPRLGTSYLDSSFNSRCSTTMHSNGWQTIYTATIQLSELGSDKTIYLGNRWGIDAVTNDDLELTDNGGSATKWDLESESYVLRNADGSRSADASNGSRGVAADTKTSPDSTDDGGAAKSRSVKSLRSTKGASATRGASTQRGIQPGTESVDDLTNNAAAPDPGERKKYVIDDGFTDPTDVGKPYTVTLTQAANDLDHNHQTNTDDPSDSIWQQLIKDLPSRRADGAKYYYYIKEVNETNLPKNTTCTIDVDDTDPGKPTKVLAFKDGTTEPSTLFVTNRVGVPGDIDILKVEAASDGTYTNQSTHLDGAVFRLMRWDKVLVPGPNPGDDPTESEDWVVVTDHKVVRTDAQTTEITFNQTTGDFTVPAGGATVTLLDPGSYKLVEVTPPPGYIMDTTDYEFSVGQDGKIPTQGRPAHVTGDYEVTVPNKPGSELPMSGGPGTVAGTVAGMALMAVGALMLLRNRRMTALV